MENHGTIKQKNVNADQAHNGMETFVSWNKIVMEAWFGYKVHGHVNAQQLLCGMELIVSLIHVLVERYGIILEGSVFV